MERQKGEVRKGLGSLFRKGKNEHSSLSNGFLFDLIPQASPDQVMDIASHIRIDRSAVGGFGAGVTGIILELETSEDVKRYLMDKVHVVVLKELGMSQAKRKRINRRAQTGGYPLAPIHGYTQNLDTMLENHEKNLPVSNDFFTEEIAFILKAQGLITSDNQNSTHLYFLNTSRALPFITDDDIRKRVEESPHFHPSK